MNESIKHLNIRFVSDYNLPIQLVHEPYFTDRLELLENDYHSMTEYKNILSIIDKDYHGSPDEFLSYYHQVRDNIIMTIIESDAYKDFLENKNLCKQFTPITGNRNLYINDNDNCFFISYDMKKANFQTMRYVNPDLMLNADSYEDFIGKFTDLDYIKKSKYTRQVIFGKMNPKRTMNVEKWITNEMINEMLQNIINDDKVELYSMNADEIIFKCNMSEDEFNNYSFDDIVWNGVHFRFNKFKLHSRQFQLAISQALLTIYEKEDYLNNHKHELFCVPSTYFSQVYKLLHGMEINENDLVFYYEHELCKFMNPLKLIK